MLLIRGIGCLVKKSLKKATEKLGKLMISICINDANQAKKAGNVMNVTST